jgi:hypothetical protein
MESQEAYLFKEKARLLKKYSCATIDEVLELQLAQLAEKFIP